MEVQPLYWKYYKSSGIGGFTTPVSLQIGDICGFTTPVSLQIGDIGGFTTPVSLQSVTSVGSQPPCHYRSVTSVGSQPQCHYRSVTSVGSQLPCHYNLWHRWVHNPRVTTLYNVSSCWIYEYTGILLGVHYILHSSRIRVKQQNLPFLPRYCTTACSKPLASHNFCLHTVPNCEFNFQLRRYRSLTTSSFTPSSHPIIGIPTGRLQANSAVGFY